MKKRSILQIAIMVIVTLALFTISGEAFAKDDSQHPADSSTEVRYQSHIKPILEKHCIKCHGQDSPEYGNFEKDKAGYKVIGKGPKMDSYSDLIFFIGWPDTGAVMRRLDDGKNTKDGKPGNMYNSLGDSEEERQKNLGIFREWIGNWRLEKWPAITKEELNRIKVPY